MIELEQQVPGRAESSILKVSSHSDSLASRTEHTQRPHHFEVMALQRSTAFCIRESADNLTNQGTKETPFFRAQNEALKLFSVSYYRNLVE